MKTQLHKTKKQKLKKYVLLQDIVIPKGTVFDRAPNQRGGIHSVEAIIALGKDSVAYLNTSHLNIEDAPADLITELK